MCRPASAGAFGRFSLFERQSEFENRYGGESMKGEAPEAGARKMVIPDGTVVI
ncbi:MAG: hypothetical protein A4E65_01080 [Syntrophorhabdus sp. PtaU1.Bin153]|nr:MAG: hypothetical protein A4E65_01080 [Syntrophorhabdus sp. PtaU1.Bin153]